MLLSALSHAGSFLGGWVGCIWSADPESDVVGTLVYAFLAKNLDAILLLKKIGAVRAQKRAPKNRNVRVSTDTQVLATLLARTAHLRTAHTTEPDGTGYAVRHR